MEADEETDRFAYGNDELGARDSWLWYFPIGSYRRRCQEVEETTKQDEW